jgi:hypothetical protein
MWQEELRLCAQRSPGAWPQYLWNARIGGKTRARNLPLGPELEKVEKEVQTYQAFVRLTQEWMEINDRICQMRPVHSIGNETELEELKKNCGGVLPRSRSGDKSPHGARPARSPATRTPGPGSQRNGDSCSYAPDGRHLLQKLLHSDGGGCRGAHLDCGHGHAAEFAGYRGQQILTVRSSVEVQRAYYHGPACQSGWVPKDQELDVVGSSFRPGVRRMMGRVQATLAEGFS